jgi:hypothetical protein
MGLLFALWPDFSAGACVALFLGIVLIAGAVWVKARKMG